MCFDYKSSRRQRYFFGARKPKNQKGEKENMREKGNIRLGLTIFVAIAMALLLPGLGIAGSLEPPSHAVDGSGNPVPTTLPKFACRGAFINNNDGTVTDCKTGMIWMRDANCFGGENWSIALASCAALATGSCSLSDGSSAGDWHLPTIEELKTLPDRAYSNPALSNAKGDAQWTEANAFISVQSGYYWSSTTNAYYPGGAWYVGMGDGSVVSTDTTFDVYVWCVRGGN